MPDDRKTKLEKNLFKIFFINALLNVKMINVIISLFYVYRSLTVPDIFYLGVVYSAAVVLSEIPSSYLADKFGRKRTVIIATFFGLLHWVFYLIADSFLLFAVGTIFYALAESCMSGTDEAFVYDTNKELGNQGSSLQKLSHYFSSERIFKIASAFLGALIAKDLAQWQFSLVIMVDIIATLVAIVFAFTLVEPNHFMDVEKQEAGLIKDAYKILSKDKRLLFAIFNKWIVAIMAMTCWRYSAVLFIDNLGVSIIIFGIVWSAYHAVVFAGNYFGHFLWPNKEDTFKINILNILFSISLAIFLMSWFFAPEKYILFGLYTIVLITSALRDPFFSHMFNKQFNSYNRATALSLANFIRYVFEIPFLPIIGLLVSINIIYPYVVALIFGLSAIFYFRIKEEKVYESKTV
ncbi:MAG: MFS transporter [Candidatus Magasanikbacteria bacterium]|nr:MFS transporter [Candidatus Magasanikbacteria bacterium]